MSVKWYCEDGRDNVHEIFKRKKDAIDYAEKHPKVMEVHKYIHDYSKDALEEMVRCVYCVWKREGWDGYKFKPEKIEYREQRLSYEYSWLDDDTFVFQFGDGELSDEDGYYFIHFEYHVKDDEWIVEVYWEDETEVINYEGSEEYITKQEIEYYKELVTAIIGIEN